MQKSRLPNRENKSQKVIKLVGSMNDNINQIIRSIPCQCKCKKEIKEVLLIFGDKIEKLRAERDAYKQKYYNDVANLKQQLESLEETLSKFQGTSEWEFDTNTLNRNQEYIRNSSNFYSICALKERPIQQNQEPQIQVKDEKSIKKSDQKSEGQPALLESLQALIKKYNIQEEQLENLVKEYVNQYENQFDSEQQKKLYRLGKKLEKQVWMNKVKKDIDSIVTAKTKYAESSLLKINSKTAQKRTQSEYRNKASTDHPTQILYIH